MYFDDAILVHGKGNKERFVPVSPYLARNLMQYRMARESYFEGKLPNDTCSYRTKERSSLKRQSQSFSRKRRMKLA